MIGMVRDQKFKFLMMWLVCIMSVALCLHFNEHATDTSRIETHGYIKAVHAHHHEVNPIHLHSHQDSLYEHTVGYVSIKHTVLTLLLLAGQIFEQKKLYSFLNIKRIFKPPRKTMIY